MFPLRYYYFSTSGVSVKAVLNSSGVVDLYSLTAQLSSAQAQITTAITSNFSLVQPAVSPVGDLQASHTPSGLNPGMIARCAFWSHLVAET